MNVHTFGDAVKNKRASLADELDSGDEDDEDERRHGWKLSQEARRSYFEHEEEAGADKFNDAGEVLEPFNTIDERDGGHFDESMNYVFKKEKGELDSWLADLDEAAMERGIGETAKAMKKLEARQALADQRLMARPKSSPMELKMELLRVLQPGETVSLAMRRLSGKQSKESNFVKRRRMPSSENSQTTITTAAVHVETEDKISSQARKAALEHLTEIADQMLEAGITAIYEMSREVLENSSFLWEYMGHDGVVHGPFSSSQIAAWKAQGFFTGPSAVMMRRVAAPNAQVIRDRLSNSAASTSLPFDSSEGNNSSRKRARLDGTQLEVGKEDKEREKLEAHQELSNDFDEDDAAQDVLNINAVAEAVRGPWILSDNIDFGEVPEQLQDESRADQDDGDPSDEENGT